MLSFLTWKKRAIGKCKSQKHNDKIAHKCQGIGNKTITNGHSATPIVDAKPDECHRSRNIYQTILANKSLCVSACARDHSSPRQTLQWTVEVQTDNVIRSPEDENDFSVKTIIGTQLKFYGHLYIKKSTSETHFVCKRSAHNNNDKGNSGVSLWERKGEKSKRNKIEIVTKIIAKVIGCSELSLWSSIVASRIAKCLARCGKKEIYSIKSQFADRT